MVKFPEFLVSTSYVVYFLAKQEICFEDATKWPYCGLCCTVQYLYFLYFRLSACL